MESPIPYVLRRIAGHFLFLFVLTLAAMEIIGVSSWVPGAFAAGKETVSWVSPRSHCCPVDLKTLVVRTNGRDAVCPIPRKLASDGVQTVVFHFLGSKSFFVGVLIRAIGPDQKILRHGLFDQGPIDEVLTKTYFGTVERVRISGIFERRWTRYLVLKRMKTGQEAWIPLSSVLSAILSNIGKTPDLAWGVS